MIKYIVEFLGTFVFLSVILSHSNSPIAIAVGLLAAIYFGDKIRSEQLSKLASEI